MAPATASTTRSADRRVVTLAAAAAVAAAAVLSLAGSAAAAASAPAKISGKAAVAGDMPLAGAKIRFYDATGRDITRSVIGRAPLATCPADFAPGAGCTGRSGSFRVLRKPLAAARRMTATGGRTGALREQAFTGTLQRLATGNSGWNDPSISFLTTVAAVAKQQDGSRTLTELGRKLRRLLGLPGTFRFGFDAVNSSNLVDGSKVLVNAQTGGGFDAYVAQTATRVRNSETGLDLKTSGFSFMPQIFLTGLAKLQEWGVSMAKGIPSGVGSGAGSALFAWAMSLFSPQATRPATAEDTAAIRQDLRGVAEALSTSKLEMNSRFDALSVALEKLGNSVECEGAKTRYTTLAASLAETASNIDYLQIELTSLADQEPGGFAAEDQVLFIKSFIENNRMLTAPQKIYDTLRNDGSRNGLLYEAWQRLRSCSLAAGSPVLDARSSEAFTSVLTYWATTLQTANQILTNYWAHRYGTRGSSLSKPRIKLLELMMTELRNYRPPAIPTGVAFDPVNNRMWAGPNALFLDLDPACNCSWDQGMPVVPSGSAWKVKPAAGWQPPSFGEGWSARSPLDLAGFSDWRIPTVAQIQSLIRLAPSGEEPWAHLGKSSPAAAGGAFPTSMTPYTTFIGDETGKRITNSEFMTNNYLFYENFSGWQNLAQPSAVPAVLTADSGTGGGYGYLNGTAYQPCQADASAWGSMGTVTQKPSIGFRYVPLDRWSQAATPNRWRLVTTYGARGCTTGYQSGRTPFTTMRFNEPMVPPVNSTLRVVANWIGGSTFDTTTRYLTHDGNQGMVSLPTRQPSASESPEASTRVLPTTTELNSRIVGDPYPG